MQVPDDRIYNERQFVHWNDELTDTEAVAVVRLIGEIQMKYANKPNTKQNLEDLRDEALTRLIEINILAELDPSPCFYGESPIVEIIGKVSSDPLHKYGFDHEQKKWEIDKAHDRGEDYLGEKESSKSKKTDG